jgi:peptide/nickel transport system substrate-binding protein
MEEYHMKHLFSVLLVLLAAAFPLFSEGKQETPQQQEQKEAEADQPPIQNPDSFIWASLSDPQSLDLARAYDNQSWTVLTNIYETLITFDGASTGEYKPCLATEVPSRENGGITNGGKTYRFKIREGVTFHNGNELTPEDVEYTFERNMVVDAEGGPIGIWFSTLVGVNGSDEIEDFSRIDEAVEVDGDYVVFNLDTPFPPFLSVMASTWASIFDKEWVIEQGGWPGTAETWKEYNKPGEGNYTMDEIANGTGPYTLERWEKDNQITLKRYEDYWGEKPAMKRGIMKKVPEWSTRRVMLMQGDADAVFVDRQYYDQMAQEDHLKISKDNPTLNVIGFNFNYDIQTKDNPLVGSGKLDGNGIPNDFFADKNVRLAFAHSFNHEAYINQVLNGYGRNPVTPIPYGLPFKNTDLEGREFDLEKAEEYMKKAFDGEIWEKGFTMDILFNEGNTERRVAAKMVAENISGLNNKFEVNTRSVTWPVYLDKILNSTMPAFIIGWLPDYPDAGNFISSFMHPSKGGFAEYANYENEKVRKMVEEAASTVDKEERRELYYELQDIYLRDVVSFMTHQPEDWRFFRSWVQGNYYNPVQSSAFDLLPHIEKGYK